MMKWFPCVCLFVATSIAAPTADTSQTRVNIRDGSVYGSSRAGVDTFLGIPFAQPPVGDLRLRPPQALKKPFGKLNASAVPKSCPQMSQAKALKQLETNAGLPTNVSGIASGNPIVPQDDVKESEDCLTLNIQRPSNATSKSRLPVAVWIFGGAFAAGSAHATDATSLIQKSMVLNADIIYVAMNYRVGGWGFLAGKELAQNGSTNLGLRDQRLALRWIADNIQAFGGDPEKVTIWGESAGAISVYDHLIINRGNTMYKGRPLFRGAIMNSGSVAPADTVTSPSAQEEYNLIVKRAGCDGKKDSLSCLRNVDFDTFKAAVNSLPGALSYRSLDLSYLPRPDSSNDFFPVSPEVPLSTGKYAKVPIIIGDQEDEGTFFALATRNITTNQQLITYLASYFPGNVAATNDVTGLLDTYPNQPLIGQPAGSPFRTGALNNIYPQYKRIAAVLGDVTFTLMRRVYLQRVSSTVPCWSYLGSYLYGTPILGTFHGSDLLYIYGQYQLDKTTPGRSLQTYFISFVNKLDPNALGVAPPLINWPKWNATNPTLLHLKALKNEYLQDTFRNESAQYIANHAGDFRI